MYMKPTARLRLTECNVYGIVVGCCMTLMLIYWVGKKKAQEILMNFNDFSLPSLLVGSLPLM